jgi:[ribosomal protein S5]-alanine N-acetyltransferase
MTPTTTQTTLKTSRLVLRAARLSDTADLYKCFADPCVMEYWSTLSHTSPSQTEEWLTKMIASSQNGITDFIIADRATSIAIGKIGIWHGSEIGFMISREYWRQGLASEALEAVLPYFFETKGYEKIVADVDPRNEGSISVLGKFGFRVVGRRERTFEIGGIWVDSLDLELKRDTWRSRKIYR